MAYRNELAAAQSRGLALERELAEARRQLAEQEGEGKSTAWSRLVLRGADEAKRQREAEKRRQKKAAARARKQAIAEKRDALLEAKFTRYGAKRRRIRSATRLGFCAHWFFPVLVTSPLLCLFVLFIIVPWTLWILLAWFVAAMAIWGLANLAGIAAFGRASKRELELPFSLEGHRGALGRTFRDLKIDVCFETLGPTPRQMQQWVLGLAAESRGRSMRRSLRSTAVEDCKGTIALSPKEVVTRWMAGNGNYYRWYRRVVERGLVDLHQDFPIQKVTVLVDK